MADTAQLVTTDLTCTVGNNAAHGDTHRVGYNGLFDLRSSHCPDSPYVPRYAGWNLEHYFDGRGRPEKSDDFFEPRRQPMRLTKISDTEAELHQGDTPVYGVESWTRFRVTAPHYVDIDYRCVAHKSDLAGEFLGVFWASYINAPIDKSLYFIRGGSTLEKPRWAQFCTQAHNRDSTVRHRDDDFDPAFARTGDILYGSYSPLRFGVPFFYGRFRDMVLIYCFKTDNILRFAHSPSGGGRTPANDDTSPAWDFQLLVPNYVTGTEYALESRIIFKPWQGRADVLREVAAYFEAGA